MYVVNNDSTWNHGRIFSGIKGARGNAPRCSCLSPKRPKRPYVLSNCPPVACCERILLKSCNLIIVGLVWIRHWGCWEQMKANSNQSCLVVKSYTDIRHIATRMWWVMIRLNRRKANKSSHQPGKIICCHPLLPLVPPICPGPCHPFEFMK